MIFLSGEHDSDFRRSEKRAQRVAVSCGVRLILFTIFVGVVAVALWRLRSIVLICFGALIGAVILRSISTPLHRRLRISEAMALTLTIFLLMLFFGGLIWLFGNQTAAEFSEFQRLLPSSIEHLNAALNESSVGRALIDALKHSTADAKILSNMGILAGGLIEATADLFLLLFLSIYFAFAPDVYILGCVRLVPRGHRLRLREALLGATADLKKWLVAQLYAMLIIGVLVGVSSALLKIPLSLLLGVFAGFLEFIPTVGPVLFTIPAVLIAFTQGPASVLNVLVVYFAVQQFESNIITPLLQQRAVRVPPAVTLLAVVVGGFLLGPMGVVFGIPITVVLISLGKKLL